MSEPDYVASQPRALDEDERRVHGTQRVRAWAEREHTWGVFGVPERELHALGDVAGLDVVELGCGTAYLSAWLARRGARPVGVDVTPAQLETARAMQRETGLTFPLIEANAEDVPLPDATFDLAISEYGASIWCDPYRWIPEAHRLLRAGGRLVFLCSSPLNILCAVEEPDSTSETLQRPQRGMHRLDWSEAASSSISDTEICFDSYVNRASKSRASSSCLRPTLRETHEYYSAVTADWARKWPSEDLWVARKRG